MSYPRCIVCYRSVGWIGLVVNLCLSFLKVFVGLISGSQALVIDALYSAKDVLTSFLILFGLKYSRQPIDEEHQFGHGKAEFLFSLTVGLSMMVITGLFVYFEAGKLLSGVATHKAPHMIALWAALFVLGANVFLWYYTRCVSIQINSPIVSILSQHQKSDAYSSLAVACGIVGSHYLGLPWLDTLVAVGECLDLFHLGIKISWDSFQGLMDVAAPRELVRKIHDLASTVSGVRSVEEVQTRRIGQEIWISLVIGVDPELTVERGKEISLWVESRLVDSIPHLGDVSVHFKSAEGSLPELKQVEGEIAAMRQQLAQMQAATGGA
ncbi:MAG: magnetosome biogenesis CDF transporter MamM [Magnetococcales bacterium]|nr:magnetosome biogenesis CDF transporter MamM [Magnetococcales bacterium]MBF0157549.1 magnetosome biogenesis CDF transporter MamM [Magnetococcales bacterium]